MYVYKWSQDLMYKNNVSKKERKEKIHNILTTSLKKMTLPLTQWSQKLTLPLRVTTFISKTTLPFCHEWQKVECQVDILSVELASPSTSSEAWFPDHTWGLYRKASKSRQIKVLRGVEVSVEEVPRKWSSTAEVSRRYREITHQHQEQKLDRSTRYRGTVEDTD